MTNLSKTGQNSNVSVFFAMDTKFDGAKMH